VSTESRTEVISVLRRFVHGQLSFDELQGFVRSRNFGWLDELLDGIELSEMDYRELGLCERSIARELRKFTEGETSASKLADWAFETYRIYSSGDYPTSSVYSPDVEIALLMGCLLTDCSVNDLLSDPRTSSPRRKAQWSIQDSSTTIQSSIEPLTQTRKDPKKFAKRIAERVLDALERGQPVPAEMVVRQLLSRTSVVRLLTRSRPKLDGLPPDHSLWADVAMVTTPIDVAPPSADQCWFIPLAVCCRELWLENPPDGAWGHPENDRMHLIREEFPHLDLEEFDPMYFVGPDGIAEIALATDQIDEAALRTAVRLFCLKNRIRRCTIDGAHCYPNREDR